MLSETALIARKTHGGKARLTTPVAFYRAGRGLQAGPFKQGDAQGRDSLYSSLAACMIARLHLRSHAGMNAHGEFRSYYG